MFSSCHGDAALGVGRSAAAEVTFLCGGSGLGGGNCALTNEGKTNRGNTTVGILRTQPLLCFMVSPYPLEPTRPRLRGLRDCRDGGVAELAVRDNSDRPVTS